MKIKGTVVFAKWAGGGAGLIGLTRVDQID
jgi:hypothetical protein